VITVDELATIPLFSALAQNELQYLVGAVEDIHLVPGEYVAHEGEGRFLAVVVEGKTELTKLVNGVEQVIGIRLPGELGGEIPMTLGTPLPASMRAVEPSRVLKLKVEVFHTLAAMAPQVSATVSAAALEAPGDAQKRHRAAARARDVRDRPAARPGSPHRRELS
jgi:thioredoxin reductase (NADPH)